ncbi:PAS domain S-box protein [Methylobacterium sp. CM6257]
MSSQPPVPSLRAGDRYSAGSTEYRTLAPYIPYLYAVGLVLIGGGLRILLDPYLGDRVVFLFLVPAVLVAAAGGGLLPGLFATAAGVIMGSAILFRQGIIFGNQVDAVLFAGLGGYIAIGAERLRQAQRRALEVTGALLQQQAHLKSILETVPDAMIVIDEHGLVQSFSAAAERTFGWSAAEVEARNVKMLMPAPDRDAHDGYLERYARTGERRIIAKGRVVTGQRKDGSTFPMELAIGEMTSGGRKYYTGFVRDLTERQQTERRLQEMQAELLHMSRLSAMGEMAATLAHELNQPLAAITNYLKAGRRLIVAEQPESVAIEAMTKAADQALRAGQIIRRLREFVSRGECDRRVESLPELLQEASALALVGAEERGVRVRVERDAAVTSVLVDKVQIQQVLLNLMRNALEAMETSTERELTVDVVALSPDVARVSVADTGSGISPEVADQLFQPFVTTKGARGMGVGLSVCRTIIEAHGGRIWAEPNRSGGTVFHFTLPRAGTSSGVPV